jgi:hypothetical protein
LHKFNLRDKAQGAAQRMTRHIETDRQGMSDNGVAVEAHIGAADVKLRSSGHNQRARDLPAN